MIWFEFQGASFLIKGLDAEQVVSLDERIKKGELTEKEAKFEIFSCVLVQWRGIGEAGTFCREEELKALFDNQEIQNFILQKSAGMLEQEIMELERAGNLFEQTLLKTGKLKS